MGQLEDMAMFVRIVEASSITKAAEQLNIAKSAISRRLKELETRFGTQLINRTTRQSHLTQNGEFLVDMAVKGHGITFVPTFIAYKRLALDELVPVLKQYQLPTLNAYAVYPNLKQYQLPTLNAYAVYPKNRFLSQRCRYLIEYIAERFGDNPYWDEF